MFTPSHDILDRRERSAITKKTADYCIPREGGELRRFVVTGWLWRVKRGEDDDDYHLEITDSPTRFSRRCLVAEIPDARYGAGYARVRAALDRIIGAPVADRPGTRIARVRIE